MDKLLNELIEKIIKFRDDRNWAQYHKPKDLAICLNVEATEVLELFLWKGEESVNIEKLKDELGDVFYSLLLLANSFSIDLEAALTDKLKKNEVKYPVSEFKSSNKKYNE